MFLSLAKEQAIEPKERESVLTALFSRADTGLLKHEGTPAMPGPLGQAFEVVKGEVSTTEHNEMLREAMEDLEVHWRGIAPLGGFAAARKLGVPAQDRWRSESGELQYRLLWYPQRAYFVLLMGSDRDTAHYVGALDGNWHVIHHVDMAGGGNTGSLLRALPRF